MRNSRVVVGIISLIAGLVAAVPVAADTVTLLSTKDNTLYEPITQDGFADMSDL